MKKVLTAAALLTFVSSAAFAGGPVIIPDESEPDVIIAKDPASKGWLLLIPLLGCAALCGGGDS